MIQDEQERWRQIEGRMQDQEAEVETQEDRELTPGGSDTPVYDQPKGGASQGAEKPTRQAYAKTGEPVEKNGDMESNGKQRAPNEEKRLNDKELDRLVKAVESLQGRIEAMFGVRSPDREKGHSFTFFTFSPADYKEVFDYRDHLEKRVRRSVIGKVLRVSILVLVLLALGGGVAGWAWLEQMARREADMLAKTVRETVIPQTVRERVDERLNTVIQEKSAELMQIFREEMKQTR
ncbi:MAG: hypothetical protein ACE5JS_16270 [Nitrospinota bacterium]